MAIIRKNYMKRLRYMINQKIILLAILVGLVNLLSGCSIARLSVRASLPLMGGSPGPFEKANTAAASAPRIHHAGAETGGWRCATLYKCRFLVGGFSGRRRLFLLYSYSLSMSILQKIRALPANFSWTGYLH